MDATDKVELERHGAFAEIVLNRPERLNALDSDCISAIDAYLSELDSDSDVRAVLLRGEGRAFCSGADLDEVTRHMQDPAQYESFLEEWHDLFWKIETLPMATVAAVDGVALAGGFELLQVCDVVIVGDQVQIADHHAKLGIFPSGGSTQRLPRLIGPRRAKWLLISGEPLDPKSAVRLGLANEAVPMEAVLPRAREVCELLSGRSPLVTRHVKESMARGAQMELRSALALERKIAVNHSQSEDPQRGLLAFREGSEPEFSGR